MKEKANLKSRNFYVYINVLMCFLEHLSSSEYFQYGVVYKVVLKENFTKKSKKKSRKTFL